MAPDHAFAFVESPCCPTLDFVCVFWIMITFGTIANSLILEVRIAGLLNVILKTDALATATFISDHFAVMTNM